MITESSKKFQEYSTAGICLWTTRRVRIERTRFNVTDYEVTAICRYGIKISRENQAETFRLLCSFNIILGWPLKRYGQFL